jgi:hypothetical protein
MHDLSIVILNWNTRDLLAECLTSVRTHSEGLSVETIVVDNASTDGSPEMVRQQFPWVRLIPNRENVGFSRGNNLALALSQARYVLLLNSDARVTAGALTVLVKLADAQPKAGILGAQLLNTDGTFQASHSPFPNLWQEFLILSGLGRALYGRWYPSRGPEIEKGPQRADYVDGACLLVRRAAIEQVGGLDDGYFMYAEEVDWCYTMQRAGWEVWYQPEARILHHGGGSSRHRRTQREADLYRSRVRFFRKNYGNGSALALKSLMYVLTTVKFLVHGTLRVLSGNRKGRPVVSLSDLHTALRGV